MVWGVLGLFIVAFAASQIIDYRYDDLAGYEQFLYILMNIVLYLAIIVPILMVLMWLMFGVTFGIFAAKTLKEAVVDGTSASSSASPMMGSGSGTAYSGSAYAA